MHTVLLYYSLTEKVAGEVGDDAEDETVRSKLQPPIMIISDDNEEEDNGEGDKGADGGDKEEKNSHSDAFSVYSIHILKYMYMCIVHICTTKFCFVCMHTYNNVLILDSLLLEVEVETLKENQDDLGENGSYQTVSQRWVRAANERRPFATSTATSI